MDLGETTTAASGPPGPRDWLQVGVSPGDAPPGAVQIGHFVVLRVLGSGGMGIVYSAYDEKLDRKVAVKLLRGDLSTQTQRRQTRMVREAQAMAKLSHPNVVQIYEVGTHGGQIFLAMEFIEGGSLRRWLRDEQRSWREVLAMFIQAGRGLAAAHRAGIIHRDFKPDNVLVDKTQTAKVTDFGTARAAVLSGEHTPVSDEEIEEPTEEPNVSGSASMLEQRLTITGRAVGTPAYMSPEQHFGDPVDARSDQFGFCVALFEALYGDRPFRGADRAALAARVAEGTIPDPPPGTKVPSWVRKAVLRGLSTEPEDRFPDMDALLSELDRDPHRGRKWLAAGAVAAVLLGGAPFLLTGDAPCQDMDAPLFGVWDEARKESIEQAFLATKLPFAADAWKSVETSFDRYTEGWVETRTQACEATHEGSQSADMLDLRMACLDRRLGSLSSLTDLFADADPQVVENAAEAASSLPDLAFCNNTEALRLAVRPPEDPETARKVGELRATLDQVASLELAGRYKESLDLAEKAVETARTIDYDPVLAEALYHLGAAQNHLDDGPEAQKSLLDAVDVAESSRHDELAAQAWSGLVGLAGRGLADTGQGLQWLRRGRSKVTRLGAPRQLEARLLGDEGRLHFQRSDFAAAERATRRAIEFYTRLSGAESLAVAHEEVVLASELAGAGRTEDAVEHHERALEIYNGQLGPEHPGVATQRYNLGSVLLQLGQRERAQAELDAALAILTKVYGTDSLRVAQTHRGLAELYRMLAKLDLAHEHARRANQIHERALPPDHPERLKTLTVLGNVLLEREDYEGALDAYQEVVRTLGPKHPDDVLLGILVGARGEALIGLGRFEEAMGSFARSLEILEKHFGPDHEYLAYALKGQGQVHLALGNPGKAVVPLERAHAIWNKHPGVDPTESAEVTWGLARALYEGGVDRRRATDLAAAAQSEYELLPGGKERAAEVAKWRARRKQILAIDRSTQTEQGERRQ